MNLGLGLGLPYGSRGTVAPLAPSIAPVLSVATIEFGSYIAPLSWTASNRVGGVGSGYQVWAQLIAEEPTWTQVDTTTDTSYNYDGSGLGDNALGFYVVPYNAVGEGPSSNTVSVTLPGESEGGGVDFRLLENGATRLLEDDSELLLEIA